MPTNTRPPLPPIQRVKSKDRTREFKWLDQHWREYAGHWVAVEGDVLVAHGFDADKFFAEVKASGVTDPLFDRIEPLDQLPYGGGCWLKD